MCVAISGCAKAGTVAAPDAAPDAEATAEPDAASCKWLHAVNKRALLKHTQAAQRLRNTGVVSNCFLDMRVLLVAYRVELRSWFKQQINNHLKTRRQSIATRIAGHHIAFHLGVTRTPNELTCTKVLVAVVDHRHLMTA